MANTFNRAQLPWEEEFKRVWQVVTAIVHRNDVMANQPDMDAYNAATQDLVDVMQDIYRIAPNQALMAGTSHGDDTASPSLRRLHVQVQITIVVTEGPPDDP